MFEYEMFLQAYSLVSLRSADRLWETRLYPRVPDLFSRLIPQWTQLWWHYWEEVKNWRRTLVGGSRSLSVFWELCTVQSCSYLPALLVCCEASSRCACSHCAVRVLMSASPQAWKQQTWPVDCPPVALWAERKLSSSFSVYFIPATQSVADTDRQVGSTRVWIHLFLLWGLGSIGGGMSSESPQILLPQSL